MSRNVRYSSFPSTIGPVNPIKKAIVILKAGVLFWAVPASILAIAVAWVVLCLAAVVYALRGVYWLFVEDGRIYRLKESHNDRLIAIERRGEQARNLISDEVDRRNLNDLLRMTHDALEGRKNEIMRSTLENTKEFLTECKIRHDFDTMLQVYRLIVESKPSLLNQLISEHIS